MRMRLAHLETAGWMSRQRSSGALQVALLAAQPQLRQGLQNVSRCGQLAINNLACKLRLCHALLWSLPP